MFPESEFGLPQCETLKEGVVTHSGRHFLQIPGPTNVPDRVLRAIAQPTIDHRGPDFAELALDLLQRVKPVFGTSGPVVIDPSSGTGAWEAALVNTLSPGDRVLAFETGHFATLWRDMTESLGLVVDFVPGDWRRGVDPAAVAERLAADKAPSIAAVMVVHNETSTGVTSRVPEIRAAIDRAEHPALLLVEPISSLGSIDYRHDEWGVDVTISCSQIGLMLPPGLGFNAVSEKALAAAATARLRRPTGTGRPSSKPTRAATTRTPLRPTSSTASARRYTSSRRRGCPMSSRGTPATPRRPGPPSGTGVSRSSALTSASTPVPSRPCCWARSTTRTRSTASSWNASTCRWAPAWASSPGACSGSATSATFNDLTLGGTLFGVQMGLELAGVPVDPAGLQAALEVLRAG
jgi:alanine-glyoxylate transaminase/serine-glyoxylate transaminase/serine-pyruvate transaminase